MSLTFFGDQEHHESRLSDEHPEVEDDPTAALMGCRQEESSRFSAPQVRHSRFVRFASLLLSVAGLVAAGVVALLLSETPHTTVAIPGDAQGSFLSLSENTCSQPLVNMNNGGSNLKKERAANPGECCSKCLATPGCVGYSLIEARKECWLKASVAEPVPDKWATSGSVRGGNAWTSGAKAAHGPVHMVPRKSDSRVKCLKPLKGLNSGGRLIGNASATDHGSCCTRCVEVEGCVGYTWVHAMKECWLKSRVDEPFEDTFYNTYSGSVVSALLVEETNRPSVAPLLPPTSAVEVGLRKAVKSQGHMSLGEEQSLKLLGKTLRMTVDISQIGCGCVTGVYLVERGDGSDCDASGYFPGRCGEIDLMEANRFSWHSTLHQASDHPGMAGGFGGVQQPDMNFGQGPRDMRGDQYGPGGSIVDTSRPFTAAVSFPQATEDGSLLDMVVMLYQEGSDRAIEWRVNKPRADAKRSPPLTCDVDWCQDCFKKPGCVYKQEDLKEFGAWLSQGMTPLSTFWGGKGNTWLDGVMGGEPGGCALGQQGVPSSEELGDYSDEAGCGDADYSVSGFTLEDIAEPNTTWTELFRLMDGSPVIMPLSDVVPTTTSSTTTTPPPSVRATLAPAKPPAEAVDAGLSPAGPSEGHASLAWERSAKLLGKTLRMRVDVSQVGCGCVTGVYLVEWGDGGACDASGSFAGRCGEIDIMEGNKFSWHSTLHNAQDQAGLCGGTGGVGQPDQNFGKGPRDMTSDQYGPGGSIIDTNKEFFAAVSFPAKQDGSLADMVVMLYQEGQDAALEWRVNKPRADSKRSPPLTCEDDSCPNCFSKPGCVYKDADLEKFGSWLSEGMTPLSTYWGGSGNGWIDGVMPDEHGGCQLDGQGEMGTQTKGDYAGGAGCNGGSYSVDSFTIEDIKNPEQCLWDDLFKDMDAHPVVKVKQ